MFITIQDPKLDKAFDALCAAQRPPLKRNTLGAAMIREAVAAFEATGDALVWQKMGAPENEAPAA